MDLALPGDGHPARIAFREWLVKNPEPSPRELAAAGYVAPHWPRPWGLDADPVAQLVIDDELRRAGVRRAVNQIGMGGAGQLAASGVDAGALMARTRALEGGAAVRARELIRRFVTDVTTGPAVPLPPGLNAAVR